MPERATPILRVVCLVLAILVVYQLARLIAGRDPLAELSLPQPVNPLDSPLPPTSPNPTPEPAANLPSFPPDRVPGMPPGQVPPALRPTVDRIARSEIFGAVPRPMPMALLGIGGHDAFIRTPNGQAGLLREGEELDGLKLLRIGINRVLIEIEGQQQELTLFSGLGGETLLPKEREIHP
jgi:hypothetical protein